MSSLYVDRQNVELRIDGGALCFYENGGRVGTVPLAPLSRVFLRGDVLLSASVLGKLGAHGVGVVVLSGRKAEPTLLMARPHNDAARRVAQFRLSQDEDFCLAFSRALVRDKVAAQIEFLKELREDYMAQRYPLTVRLRTMEGAFNSAATCPTVAGLRGVEGAAAAAYFIALADVLPDSLGFVGRRRRPPPDPFNAVLSLGYTLLHGETVTALYGSGLDPFVGFFHALDFGRESLAADVMEPLRAHVDRFALRLFRSRVLRAEDFSKTESGCLLGKAGRERFYRAWEEQAEAMRQALARQVDMVMALIEVHGDVPHAAQDWSEDTQANEISSGDEVR